MSVRAYRLLEIKTADNPTFNYWYDTKILSLANNDEGYNDGGILSFERYFERYGKK